VPDISLKEAAMPVVQPDRRPAFLRALLVVAAVFVCAPVAAQMTGAATPYLEAQSLVSQGRSADAMARLEAWRPTTAPERAQRHWALAVLLREAGRPDEALPHLEAVVALRPDVAEFRAALATVLQTLGQESRAEFHRERAQAGTDGPRPVAPPPAAQRLPLWSGSLGFSVNPESNPGQRSADETVVVAGLPLVIDPDARAQPGTVLSFQAQGAWQPELRPGVNARIGLALSGDLHDGPVADETRLTVDAGLLRRTAAGGRVQAALSWTEVWRDGEAYSHGPGLSLGLTRPVGPRGRLTLTGAVQDLRYPALVGWDGPRSLVAVGYSHALAPNTVLRGGLRLERTNVPSESVSYSGATLSLGASHAFRGGLSLDVEVAHRATRHDAPVALFGTLREDRRDTLTLRVLHSRVAVAGFAPVVELGLERQRSTIPIYSYENMGLSLGLTRRF